MTILVISSTISTANPGGKGDDTRSRDCAGSCHSSPSTNGQSSAVISLEFPDQVYAGLLFDLGSSVGGVDVSSNNMVGFNLLINEDGAKDLPSVDGWEIVTDPNGGTNNFVEIVDSFSSLNTVNRSWTLRAPTETGTYQLFLAVQHGTPGGGIAMTGISSGFTVDVLEVPENLPRISPDWEPVNTRLIGEETEIQLDLIFTENATVELRNGGNISTLPVEENKFTIPASVNEGVVEWRVIMEGEGPTQTSPWFRLSAQEPGWQVDETALYLQGFALLILFAGFVISQGKNSQKIIKNYQHELEINSFNEIETQESPQSSPPLPESGLPPGWTMEQWEYYGQQHLDSLEGDSV